MCWSVFCCLVVPYYVRQVPKLSMFLGCEHVNRDFAFALSQHMALLGIVVLGFGLGCDLSSVWRFVICGMVVCDTPLLVSPWHSFVCALVSVSLSGIFHR